MNRLWNNIPYSKTVFIGDEKRMSVLSVRPQRINQLQTNIMTPIKDDMVFVIASGLEDRYGLVLTLECIRRVRTTVSGEMDLEWKISARI
jgi:hypothetical protein